MTGVYLRDITYTFFSGSALGCESSERLLFLLVELEDLLLLMCWSGAVVRNQHKHCWLHTQRLFCLKTSWSFFTALVSCWWNPDPSLCFVTTGWRDLDWESVIHLQHTGHCTQPREKNLTFWTPTEKTDDKKVVCRFYREKSGLDRLCVSSCLWWFAGW